MVAPLSQATVNLGTLADSAWSALQSGPSPQTATAYHDAIVAYAAAALQEFAAQADAANTQVTGLQRKVADLTLTLQNADAAMVKLQQQQAGTSITPASGGGTTTPATPAGTYTAGQVGAATVGGALFGWLANVLWREHETKTHARERVR